MTALINYFQCGQNRIVYMVGYPRDWLGKTGRSGKDGRATSPACVGIAGGKELLPRPPLQLDILVSLNLLTERFINDFFIIIKF